MPLQRTSDESTRGKWWLPSAVALIGVAVLVGIALIVGSGGAAEPNAMVADGGTCADPSTVGAVHVTGNRLLGSNNKRLMLYGIAVYGGLEAGGTDAEWESHEAAAVAQIKAAPHWHANTVRLQIAEENLFNNGKPKDGVNHAFLDAVCQEVQDARSENLDVVLSDQTEWPDWTERNATARTKKFWKVLAPVFGNEPGIMFDLFNEPHLFYPKVELSYKHGKPPINGDWVWKIWQRGGYAAKTHWVGMQSLVSEIRGMGLSNVVWVQTPYYDDTLGLASKYPVKGTNMVWSLHHPNMISAADWTTNFGYLTKHYPVIDGEWSQYASNRPECRPNAYTMLPKYLKYLRAHHIGLMAWSLQPGVMLADPQNLEPSNTTVSRDSSNPKDLYPDHASHLRASYACNNDQLGDGNGELIAKYFRRYGNKLS